MQPWKPILVIVPAGLLLGIVAGQASRPEMLTRDERPWPRSVAEQTVEIEPWRPIYESGPQDLSPRGYSSRPALDYEVFAWPDQTDRSGELLAADYEYDYGPDPAPLEPDLPLTRRATVELAASHARRVAAEAAAVAAAEVTPAEPAAPAAERATVVLPPVPPPLAQAGDAHDLAAPGEAAAIAE